MSKGTQAEYGALLNAIHRCHNPKHRAYKNYGAKGIEVCAEWRILGEGAFARFLDHIGPRPSPELSLDRIDNSRGYEPGNVRWATRYEQQNNQSNNIALPFRELAKEVAEKVGCCIGTARDRVKRFRKTGDDSCLWRPRRVNSKTRATKTIDRSPAVLKPIKRNRGENRYARNQAIARDWDAMESVATICERHKISKSSLRLIVRGEQ